MSRAPSLSEQLAEHERRREDRELVREVLREAWNDAIEAAASVARAEGTRAKAAFKKNPNVEDQVAAGCAFEIEASIRGLKKP